MILLRVGLFSLLLLTFSQTQAGPVVVKGKENVFKYTIKVGKNVGPTFKQGLLINLTVSARKKVDDTFTLKVSLLFLHLTTIL